MWDKGGNMPIVAEIIIFGFSLVGLVATLTWVIGLWGNWQNPYGL